MPERRPIHSSTHRVLARVLAAQLCAFVAFQLASGLWSAWHAHYSELAWWPVLATAALFIARQCVIGTPRIFVSALGIHLGEGPRERLLEWSKIRGVSQVPQRPKTVYWSQLYRVALWNGRDFEFSGVANTLELLGTHRPTTEHPPPGRDLPLSP